MERSITIAFGDSKVPKRVYTVKSKAEENALLNYWKRTVLCPVWVEEVLTKESVRRDVLNAILSNTNGVGEW